MLRFGKPVFLEASSRGDKRFSPYFAYVDGRAIEEHYQRAKVFHGGERTPYGLTTREVYKRNKGRFAINYDELRLLYTRLWDRYIDENPELHAVLCQSQGISDMFGSSEGCCQARELWRIREKLLGIPQDYTEITTLDETLDF